MTPQSNCLSWNEMVKGLGLGNSDSQHYYDSRRCKPAAPVSFV